MSTPYPVPYDQTLFAALGIELQEHTPQRVTARMPVDQRTHQPFGLLHGGASVALAESLASIGAHLNTPEGDMAVGLEINANHLRGVRSGWVYGVATPIHIGRRTQVWGITIHDEQNKPVCISRCTLTVIPASGP